MVLLPAHGRPVNQIVTPEFSFFWRPKGVSFSDVPGARRTFLISHATKKGSFSDDSPIRSLAPAG